MGIDTKSRRGPYGLQCVLRNETTIFLLQVDEKELVPEELQLTVDNVLHLVLVLSHQHPAQVQF